MSSGEVDDFYENWNPNKKKFYSNNFSEQMTNYKECQAIKA